jgi:hypothetical protein
MKATVVGIYGSYYGVRLAGHKEKIILAKTRGKLRLKDKSGSWFEPDERQGVSPDKQFSTGDSETKANACGQFNRSYHHQLCRLSAF